MASFIGRQRWRQTLISIWQRSAILVLVVAVVVLGSIGIGVYALVHGFGPSVGVWTQLQKTGAPPLEENGLAAYDPQVGKQIRCFGGPPSDTPISTWAFDPQTCTWTRLPASGPQPTSEELGLVYNETTGKIMRLGYSLGQNDYDTWAYDSQTNSWNELTTNGSPPARNQPACAYDKSMGRLLLFGGSGHFEKAEGGLLGDTWSFDSSTSTWTELKPAKSPPAEVWATMAYDDAAGRMIIFGGFAGKLMADTWSYDSAENTWTKLRTAGSPGPRQGASMFYDPTLHRLVMTGGQEEYPATPMLPDCWALSY